MYNSLHINFKINHSTTGFRNQNLSKIARLVSSIPRGKLGDKYRDVISCGYSDSVLHKRKTCSFYRSRSAGVGDGASREFCRESTLFEPGGLLSASVTLFKRVHQFARVCVSVSQPGTDVSRELRSVLTSATIHAVRANLAGA